MKSFSHASIWLTKCPGCACCFFANAGWPPRLGAVLWGCCPPDKEAAIPAAQCIQASCNMFWAHIRVDCTQTCQSLTVSQASRLTLSLQEECNILLSGVDFVLVNALVNIRKK